MNTQWSWSGVCAATLLLGACAATPGAKTAGSAQARAAAEDPNCLHDTGSRIADPNRPCRGFGRSYSSRQIDATGATTAAEALRLLDPAIQVRP